MLAQGKHWFDRLWAWFVARAEGPHALVWLAVCSLLDPIISPIPPEAYIAALMLAKPSHWRRYLLVCIPFAVVGAVLGYVVGAFLFHIFGMTLIHLWGLEHAFRDAQRLLRGHVFFIMILITFLPVPEKAFVLAAGFLHVHFIPFIGGFLVGRAVRIALITYLTQRYGMKILKMVERYSLWFAGALLLILLYYGMVHFHVFGL